MLKDFMFLVQCNCGPTIKIGVVAETYDEAKEYVKNMYACQCTTYADDRFNNWVIKDN
jgi:hypothetical protein